MTQKSINLSPPFPQPHNPLPLALPRISLSSATLTFSPTDGTISLLHETPRLDIPAINAEFQEEYDKLEAKSRELDLEFQTVVKELRLWIAASLEPATVDARVKYVPSDDNGRVNAQDCQGNRVHQTHGGNSGRCLIIASVKLIAAVAVEDCRLHEGC